MPELYQAEWCPHSRKVRQRLTELGVDFIARQVPADKSERGRLEEVAGTDTIPVLIDGAAVLRGEEEILRHLDERYEERVDAARHREKLLEDAELSDPRNW